MTGIEPARDGLQDRCSANASDTGPRVVPVVSVDFIYGKYIMNILIRLPRDRTMLGTIQLMTVDGSIILGPVDCLGKSDNEFAEEQDNPTRDPTRRGGDLPYGTYSCKAVLFGADVTEQEVHSYGPHGFIRLTPTAGDALIAAAEGKRSGLLIHGGALNPKYVQWHTLKPTHGCARVTNETIKAMLDAVGQVPGEPLTCAAVPLLP